MGWADTFWSAFFPSEALFLAHANEVIPEQVTFGGEVLSRSELLSLALLPGPTAAGAAVQAFLQQNQPGTIVPNPVQAYLNWVNPYNAWAADKDTGGGSWTTGEDMTLVIANCYRVSIVALSGTRQIVNVVGVRGSASGQQAAACAAVQTAWKVASGPFQRMGSTYQLQYFEATDLSSTSGGIAKITDTATGPGGALNLATNAACALVKWNGDSRSRSTRGRIYYGPISEGDVNSDGRTISSSAQTSIGTAFTNFRSSLTGAGFPLVVISRATNAMHDVTAQLVEPVIATQRRRIRS